MEDFTSKLNGVFKSCMIDHKSLEKVENSNFIVFNLSTLIPKSNNWFIITLKSRQGSSFRSGLRDITQISRAILFTTNTLLSCPVDKNRIIILLEKRNPLFKKNLDKILISDYEYTISKGSINEEYLSKSILFTMLCNMLKTGKWIHVGKNMNYLVSSEFKNPLSDRRVVSFSFQLLQYKKESLDGSDKLIMKIKMFASIVLVNNLNFVSKELIGVEVLCLPKCSGYGLVESYESCKSQTKQFLTSYWNKCHGYFLKEDDLKYTVKVKFLNISYDYPSVLVLKSQIVILPQKSLDNKELIFNLIFKQLEELGNFTIEPLCEPYFQNVPCSLTNISQINTYPRTLDSLNIKKSNLYKSTLKSKPKNKFLLPPPKTLESNMTNKLNKVIKTKLPPIETFLQYSTNNISVNNYEIDLNKVLTKEFWSKVDEELEKLM